MRRMTMFALLGAMLLAACAGGQSPFEDRSDEVEIKHRIPSK